MSVSAPPSPSPSSRLIADLASCCSPITGGALSAEAAERLAGALKALADPARLRLVSLIAAHSGAEACVCQLTGPLGLSQPTVSHHLKVLTGTGLLERQQRGKWAYYRLVPGALDALAGILARAPRHPVRGLARGSQRPDGATAR